MKTTTIHLSICLCCCLLLAGITSVQSQSISKKPHTASYAAIGCLACSGSEWNNYDDIKKPDGIFATTSMTVGGYCFQTACYYSRGLMASDFQFALPATANVTGVRVQVRRMADMENAVYDYDIQLMKSLTPEGDNKASAHPWPVMAAVKPYGGINDQWGIGLTPDVINSTDFGVWLQCKNSTEYYDRTGSVDFVKVTVFYMLGGKMEEQTSEAAAITQAQIAPNPFSASSVISFSLNNESNVQIDLYDAAGKKLQTVVNENLQAGIHEFDLSRNDLTSGIYFVHITMNDETVTRKVVIE